MTFPEYARSRETVRAATLFTGCQMVRLYDYGFCREGPVCDNLTTKSKLSVLQTASTQNPKEGF